MAGFFGERNWTWGLFHENVQLQTLAFGTFYSERPITFSSIIPEPGGKVQSSLYDDLWNQED